MIDWFKRKMGLLSFAMAKVEKDSLGQNADPLGNVEGMSQTYTKGMLSDSLLRGEITYEVKELRWRLYKVLSESKNVTAAITGYDEDGLPIVTTLVNNKYDLNKVICDDRDTFNVELVVDNANITKSVLETFKSSKYDKEETKTYGLIGLDTVNGSETLGEISFNNMMNLFKDKKTIYVKRDLRPKFELEKYTKKLIVRKINKKEKLLEFYISKYPDQYNRKSRLLITEIQKIMKNPKFSDLLDINKVGFITEKTIGVSDGLEYEYEITGFDKIIEFSGNYVIKFFANIIIDGDNIFEKYKLDELETKYENKEAK